MSTAFGGEANGVAGEDFYSKPENYRITIGNNRSIEYNPFKLTLYHSTGVEEPYLMPGVRQRGVYTIKDPEVGDVHMPVVSFLYYKISKDGRREQRERLVVWTGMGYGVHKDHEGQTPSEYIIGQQVGELDPLTHRYVPTAQTNDIIGGKNFSVACIDTGANQPVLANPQTATAE